MKTGAVDLMCGVTKSVVKVAVRVGRLVTNRRLKAFVIDRDGEVKKDSRGRN